MATEHLRHRSSGHVQAVKEGAEGLQVTGAPAGPAEVGHGKVE